MWNFATTRGSCGAGPPYYRGGLGPDPIAYPNTARNSTRPYTRTSASRSRPWLRRGGDHNKRSLSSQRTRCKLDRGLLRRLSAGTGIFLSPATRLARQYPPMPPVQALLMNAPLKEVVMPSLTFLDGGISPVDDVTGTVVLRFINSCERDGY